MYYLELFQGACARQVCTAGDCDIALVGSDRRDLRVSRAHAHIDISAHAGLLQIRNDLFSPVNPYKIAGHDQIDCDGPQEVIQICEVVHVPLSPFPGC